MIKLLDDEGLSAVERCRLPVSNHFPPHVRDSLIAASATPIVPGDLLARRRAIDEADERARLRYPELFR